MTLHLDEVGRNYGPTWGVRNLNAKLDPGTMTAVLGANGAGKSTLLRLMAGWLPVTEGAIYVEGRKLRPNSVAVRRRVMLLDEPPADSCVATDAIGLTVNDYDVDRPGIEADVADWFETLGLVGTYGKTRRAMSKGQRFKVSMVCLFVVRPPIWLLDEPFSAGLDAGGLQLLEQQLQHHQAAGGAVIFTSQWPQHANRLADRALVLHKGQLISDHVMGTTVSDDLIQGAEPALAAVLTGLGAHE